MRSERRTRVVLCAITLALGGVVASGTEALAEAPPAPPGCTPTVSTFRNTTPLAIPTGPAVVSSTLQVSGAGTHLSDLDLTVDLRHTFALDVDMTLTSPSGTVETITTDNGRGYDNVFAGTTFDDQADPDGQVPYATNPGVTTDHPYQNLTVATPLVPEEPLAAFDGEDPNGTWTITISDDLASDGGSLDSWRLDLQTLPEAPATTTTMHPSLVPVPIADASVVTSTVDVTGAGTSLTDLNLFTSVTSTFGSDLDITLESPHGTIATITTDNGAGNDNAFTGTTFDDQADPDGQVPYTTNPGVTTDHPYVNLVPATPLTPEEALAAFAGEDPNGTWTLTISDDLAGDVGVLTTWRLDVTTGTCADPNAAPVADDDSYSTDEDTTLVVPVPGVLGNDSDEDGDALTAQQVSGPAHGTLTLNPDGSFAYEPAADYDGPDSFTYKASDGTATSTTATVDITVEPTCNAASPDPVACWHLDEPNATTAQDASGHGNTGTLVNGPVFGVPGVRNTALSLDGTNDHVKVADSPSLDTGDSFSLIGWIKRDDDGHVHQLFNKGGGAYQLAVMSRFDGNQVWLRKANSSTIVRSNGGVPADGRFHQVAATKNGPNSAQLYIDGQPQTEQIVSGAQVIQDTTFPLYVSATSTGNVVGGDLDEFAVYDGVLTPAQVSSTYEADAPAMARAARRSGSTTATRTAGRNAASTSRVASKASLATAVTTTTSCANSGTSSSGITGLQVTALTCAVVRPAAYAGLQALQSLGLTCTVTQEDFRTGVVRVVHACTGPGGRAVKYTSLG